MAKIDDSVKKKVPELRFKGFTDDWEERKLGEYVNFLNGRAYKQSELLDKGKYKVVRVGNFNTNDRWYYSDLELDQNKYAQKGDLLYLWATNFGPEIWSEEKVIYHYHIWKLELLNNNLDKQYLYTWLVTDKERIKQNTNGTTMVHVTKGNMEQRDFQFPGLNEQQKIGSFFKQLDDTIALHQHKLDLLKEQKKGFLQKMFPKNGEKVPELRFAGFADDWEQRKLGDVFQQTVEYIDPKENGLELWSVTVENGLTPKTERYNREFLVKKNDKFKAIHPDEIVYNPMNMTLGSIGFNNSKKDVAVSGYYVTMKLNNRFDSNYFATWLPSPNAINLYKLYATGSLIERQRVQFPTLSGIRTLVPGLKEQNKIGDFFEKLEQTITLHQRKLDLLKEQKKGFLQKMFV